MSNNPSLLALLDWAACGKFNQMLGLARIDNMRYLCKLADESNCHIKSSLGLEIHHAKHTLPDLSLFGTHSLLHIPGIIYPHFASAWETFAEDHYATMDKSVIAEFDYADKGYKLMGFFQSYSGECQSLECALDSIKFYANLRHRELTSQVSPKLQSTDKALSMIECSIKAIGAPIYIGFIDRGMCAVKLITTLTKSNLQAIVDYCSHYFHHIIASQLQNSNVLQNMLEALLVKNGNVRLSVDIDLLTAEHLGRLSFECMTSQATSKESQLVDKSTDSLDSRFSFDRHFMNYSKSLELQNTLPYGERRPSSTNLIDNEIVSIQHSHRKLLLSPACGEVKDYLLISSFNLDSEHTRAEDGEQSTGGGLPRLRGR
jgi:hypothetical protein